jgi:hypothetical protein
MDKKKHIISMVAIGIVIAGGAFYGGMQYGARNIQAKFAQDMQGRPGGNFGGGANGGQRAGGQGMQGARGGQPGIANGGAGDFASGEVISKDDTSVTIKTRDGGSKIVFFSDKTLIDKSVTGATSDLSVGQQVTVNGKTSTDGILTAQNIQIRPLQ